MYTNEYYEYVHTDERISEYIRKAARPPSEGSQLKSCKIVFPLGCVEMSGRLNVITNQYAKL